MSGGNGRIIQLVVLVQLFKYLKNNCVSQLLKKKSERYLKLNNTVIYCSFSFMY